MSEHRQIFNMDKEAENMDEISCSPAFSMNSETFLEELMHLDDVLEDPEVTCRRSHSTLSEESWMTYSSAWCSSLDSDISEMTTPFDQISSNIDEEITQVCQSFLNPDNLETEPEPEEFGGKEKFGTTETEPTSRLASCASSSSTKAITMIFDSCYTDKEAENMDEIPCSPAFSMNSETFLDELMHLYDVFEDPEVTCPRSHSSISKESRLTYPSSWCSSPDSDISEMTTPFDQNIDEERVEDAAEAVKTLDATWAVKTLDAAEAVKTLDAAEAVKTLDAAEAVKTLDAAEAVKTLDAAEAVKTLDAAEAVKTLDAAEAVKTLDATEAVKMIKDSDDPPQTDLSSSPLWSVEEEEDFIPEEIRSFVPSPPSTSSLPPAHQVDEIPQAKTVTDFHHFPLSLAPLTECFGITEHSMQRSLESSFHQALCDAVGMDTPGRISPKFTKAIAGEVIDEVNSVLSMALQASLDGTSSSITADARHLVSKRKAAKETLEEALTTMKSFLTGRCTAVKRFQTDNGLDHDSKEETLEGGCKIKMKKSPWKRCFSGLRRNMIQPAPLEHLDEAVSKQVSLCSQRRPSTTSCSAALGEDHRSTLLELVDYIEDEDQTPEDTRNVVSSLSSTSLIPPDQQFVEVTWSKCLEDPPLAEGTTVEFQEEMNTSLNHQSTDSDEDDDDDTSNQSSEDQSQHDSQYLNNNQQVDVKESKTMRSNRFSRYLHNIFSKEQGGVAEPAPQDKMQALREQVDGVKDKMKENMERIIERAEKGVDLLAKSEEMEKGAQHLTHTSKKVARTYWWKNVKMTVVIGMVVLIIVLIIILLATGVIPINAPVPHIVTPTSKP